MAALGKKFAIQLPLMLLVLYGPAVVWAALVEALGTGNHLAGVGELVRMLLVDGLLWGGIPFVFGLVLSALVVLTIHFSKVASSRPPLRHAVLLIAWIAVVFASTGMWAMVGMFQTG